MQRDTELVIVGIALIGAYVLYQKFFGSNPSDSANALRKNSDYSRQPTQEEVNRGWSAGKSAIITKQGNTTYFYTQKDLESINPVQRLFLYLGVPQSVIFR